MPTETLGDWERGRFEREAQRELDAVTTAEPIRTVRLDDGPRDEVVALAGRMTSGFGVQLLWAPDSGATFVTCTLGGETETFEVEPASAWDAFEHPYCYGASLDFRKGGEE
jgi:hypothetical protein